METPQRMTQTSNPGDNVLCDRETCRHPMREHRRFIGVVGACQADGCNCKVFYIPQPKTEVLDAHQLPITYETERKPNTVDVFGMIKLLPTFLHQDDILPTPVMRHWTMQLPLRHQGVLVTALRGCDGAPKNDPSKGLTRMIRRAILNPADSRETTFARGFFGFDAAVLTAELPELFKSTDQYPHHYLMHLMHACEVIGYYHPNTIMAGFFQLVYAELCGTMHVNPETKAQLDHRLTLDRVAAGTVEL